MKVKVKFIQIMAETEKATLFSIKNEPVWLPKSCYSFGYGNYIICNEKFAIQKGLTSFKPLFHVPKKLTVVKNQKAADELIFTPNK